MFFAKPLQRSNLCASHRQRRWLTHGELIFDHMSALRIKTALERAAEHARRGAERNATHGVDDSDQLGFLRKDPDAGRAQTRSVGARR